MTRRRTVHSTSILFSLSLILVSMTAGCATTVHAPRNSPDPVNVYLTDYGRHSSVLLPDLQGGLIEYAFGDWKWFARGNTKPMNAVVAMLHSPQATLGRRRVGIQPDDEALRKVLGADRLMAIRVSRAQAEQLEIVLGERYAAAAIDGEFHSDYSKLDHVKDDEEYCVLHNCNHVTARWLRQLGCQVDGPAMYSNFHVAAK